MIDLMKGIHENELVRVTLEYIGEGNYGDYHEDDPTDERLLRFSVYQWQDDEEMDGGGYYREIDDASYCTQIPESVGLPIQAKALGIIMEQVYDLIQAGQSIKKVCERLSWLDAKCHWMDDPDYLPEDVSICSGCGCRTNDEEQQNTTKWDEAGDPYCVKCFSELWHDHLDVHDPVVSIEAKTSEIFKALTDEF